MRRLVGVIEVLFILLIISLVYQRYIKPLRSAWGQAKDAMNQQNRQRGPIQESPRQSSVNPNPHKPIDRSNVQDAEFEDIS